MAELTPLTEAELAGVETLAKRGSLPITPWGALRLIAELRALREAVRARSEAGNRAELIAANRRLDTLLPAKQAETDSLDRG